MKIFLSIIISLFLYRSSFAQWQKIPVDTILAGTINFSSVSFISNSVGFAAGCDNPSAWASSVLLKTTNGGNTWNKSPQPSGCVSQVFFLNENIGYNGGQTFMKTRDGGKTWHTPDSSLPGLLTPRFVYFITDTVGFIDWGNTTIGKTTDGGKTWLQKPIGATSTVASVYFTTPQIGYAVGYNNPLILKTTNSGENWNIITQQYPLLSVHFPSAAIGYAVGFNGTITKTTDAGNTWFQQSTDISNKITLRSVFCINNTTCIAVGDSGTILKTTDGGIKWSRDSSATSKNLNAITCTKNGTCFIAGDSGTLLKNIHAALSIAIPGKKKDELLIYPSPASKNITITYEGAHTAPGAYLVITDVQGRLVKKVLWPANTATIQIHDLSNGVYTCSLYSNTTIIATQKFIVAN